MESLRETLVRTMEGYAVEGFNARGYLTSSVDGRILAVVDIVQSTDRHFADAGLIVHFVDDKIIIERDMNDKVLVDALLQAGVPREQIVLAYAGEKVDAAA